MMHARVPDMAHKQACGTMRRVWTIGHSTLEFDVFLVMLRAHGIRVLADVRRFPGSRRHPHFSREALRSLLPDAGIDYVWLPGLGGRRRARNESHNDAWRNESFRGYADYMETEAFEHALDPLQRMALVRPTAYMCAEHAWQQCHRSLISDRLKMQGIEVVHILSKGRTQIHPYTEPARVIDGRLSYARAGIQGDPPR